MAEFPGSIVPEKIRLQSVADPIFRQAGVELAVLRLDEIHPDISGNKWFKLKYNLRQALESGHDTVLSFGGTWSNHLHALAAAGKKHGLRTIGVVRGDDGGALTPCLQDARRWGMQLHFVSREAYRYKQESQFIAGLAQHFGEFYLVPEGGSNLEGIRGCAEIIGYIDMASADLLCLACGTGTTLLGLLLSSELPVLGFQVLKGKGYLQEQVQVRIQEDGIRVSCPWQINDDFHFGGFARSSAELQDFIKLYQERFALPLETVYSAKMLWGLRTLANAGAFKRGTRIVAIHGGGLQGQRGFYR